MAHSVEFKNITKYFPGVKALDDVSFCASGGEVLAWMLPVRSSLSHLRRRSSS